MAVTSTKFSYIHVEYFLHNCSQPLKHILGPSSFHKRYPSPFTGHQLLRLPFFFPPNPSKLPLNNQQPAHHSVYYPTTDGLGYVPHPTWFLAIHSYINFFVGLFPPMAPQIIISFLYSVPLLPCSSYPTERRSFWHSYASLIWKDPRLHYPDFQKETFAFMFKDLTYKDDWNPARWLTLDTYLRVQSWFNSAFLARACWIKASHATGKWSN